MRLLLSEFSGAPFRLVIAALDLLPAQTASLHAACLLELVHPGETCSHAVYGCLQQSQRCCLPGFIMRLGPWVLLRLLLDPLFLPARQHPCRDPHYPQPHLHPL